MRYFFIITTLIFTASVPNAGPQAINSKFRKYIGQVYPPYPKNILDYGGFVIEPFGDDKYSLSRVTDENTSLIWFSRFTHYDNILGRSYWIIIDVLPLPKIKAGEMVVMGACSVSGEPDSEILAICKYDENAKYFNTIYQAWRANRELEKFETIPTLKVICANEGYGV